MDTGHYISGIGHGVLIGWALLGGLFSSVPKDNLEVASVSIITADEFAALSTPKPVPDAPDTTPAVPDNPVVETPPEDPTPPQDSAPSVTEVAPPPVPEPDETPPETPQPPAEDNPVVIAPPAPLATPRPSDRVTPDPVAPPPPDVAVADEAHPDNTPAPDAQKPPDPEPPAAPEESSDRIVPETSAPASSVRPSARPRRPAPPVQTATTDQPTANDNSQSIDETMRQLQAEEAAAAAASSAPAGPPLSRGQKDAFLLEVRKCWNVGALSTAALQAKVVLRFELGKDGKPNVGSIRMTGYEGGSEAVAKQAYETARRAIIRCGANGYNLPTDKYEQWKIVNITFNPENMRLK